MHSMCLETTAAPRNLDLAINYYLYLSMQIAQKVAIVALMRCGVVHEPSDKSIFQKRMLSIVRICRLQSMAILMTSVCKDYDKGGTCWPKSRSGSTT